MRDALDSRHARQFDVHEHDIGLHDVNPIQGVFTADTSPDEAHVVGGSQDLGELLAQPPVIFDNRHFLDHTSHAAPLPSPKAGIHTSPDAASRTGRFRRTVVPTARRLSMVKSPPMSCIRLFKLPNPCPCELVAGSNPPPSS